MCNLYSSPESTYIYDVHEIYSQLAARHAFRSFPAAVPGNVWQAGNKEASHSSGIKGIFDKLASCPIL